MESLEIARVDTAPEFSGDLSQEAWQRARWYGDLTVLGEPRERPAAATSFAMVHDGECLYVAVRCDEPEIARVQGGSAEENDPAVFDGDHVEVFVDAGGKARSCAQVGVTSRGATACVWYRGGLEVRGANFGVRAAAQVQEETWSAEIALPFAALGLQADRDTWKVNVTRVRLPAGAPSELSTFVPLEEAAFYQPQRFAAARVTELDSTEYLWTVRLHGPAEVSAERSGFALAQGLRLANLGPEVRQVEVRCRLEGQASETQLLVGEFGSGERREETLRTDIPTEAFGLLHVNVTDRGTGRAIWGGTLWPEDEEFSWKEHRIVQGDGKGGFTAAPARFQFLPRYEGAKVVPYGLAQMDNGEIILAGSAGMGMATPRTVIAFSSDGGATWSDYHCPEVDCGQPMMLTYLGKAELSFRSSWQRGGSHHFFSHDYGRTWPEKVKVPLSPDGFDIACEGSPLVDRDEHGIATLIAETGQTTAGGGEFGFRCRGCIQWSRDGGRTWTDFSYPDAWKWQDTYAGRTYERGSGEGALVRAANGWLVAAMRMDPQIRYLKYHYDQFEGMGVSISKDDGKTWSQIEMVCEPGRMHGNLIRLPNDDLILTVIRRLDIRGGKFASYRRGCDAFVSHDNGLTWDPDEMIVLDDWPHHDPDQWFGSVCGHLYSTLLDDGSVLTAYSKHALGGVLIHWRPGGFSPATMP